MKGFGLGGRIARFVGRRHELELLRSRLASAMKGYGQVVGMVGEAGIGKSRLLFEFRQNLKGERVIYLDAHCLSYASAIPYFPILEMLRSNCRLTDIDRRETIAHKLRRRLEVLGMDPEEAGPYLLQLLGVKEGTERLAVLSPEAINSRTLEILWQMTLKGSQRRPLILAIEDLHWIDKASETHFVSLVERLSGARILLLTTYRPGYRPPWIEKSYATQIPLEPLAPEESLSLVQSVLQRDHVPERLAQLILKKAEGNPFFLEELARAVGEHGDFTPTLAAPDTIQEVLLARIDWLSEEPKRLLQTASVLGREFSLRLLKSIWKEAAAPDPHLRELTRMEFVYERAGVEEPIYVFKHALTHEVAYASLPVSHRQALHAAAGRALEAFYAGRLEEGYERLAYHYSKTEEAAKAVEYLTRFAEKAARWYAHLEAATALKEALVHVERLPAAEREHRLIGLALRQASSLTSLGRFQQILDLLFGYQQRLERLNDPSLAGPYYFRLGLTHSFLGDHERTAQATQRALDEANRCGDEATIGKAYTVRAREGVWSGQPVQGVEDGRRAVAHLERTEERWWLAMALCYLGFNYTELGQFEPALQAGARAQAIGEAIQNTRLQAYANWTTGWTYAQQGAWEAGIEACQRAVDRSPDTFHTAQSLGFLGYAYLEKEDFAQAIPFLEQSVQQLVQFGFRQLQGWCTAWLSEAFLLDGQIDKARDLARQALEITRSARFRYGIGRSQRAMGLIAHASGSLLEAGTSLNDALQTFAGMQARFEQGRTHLALAELARMQGNQEAVTTHLKEAHNVFRSLGVPEYVKRTEGLASELDVVLSRSSA